MKQFLTIALLAFTILSCQKPSVPADPVPNHETFTVDSKQVNETRTINVWLPENYATTQESYPVLYMPDGGTKEDFPHIANTLAELIQAKKIKPVILVGIENTVRRRDLSPPTQVEKDKEIAPVVGESAKFRAFIEQELFPLIQSKYRTTDNKGIIGESLAGLFVMETFFVQPEMFDTYIAMDPSLWWNNHQMVTHSKETLANFPEKETKLWFAGSKATDINPHTKSLEESLKNNAPTQLKWTYSDEPSEEHHTIYRATKEKALIWAYN